MTPQDFQRHGIRMYGRKHWRRELALNLGLDTSTVWRISTRAKDIPNIVAVAVLGLLEKHKVISRAERELKFRRAREKHRYRGKLTGKRVRRKTNDQRPGDHDGALEDAAPEAAADVEG